MRSLFAQVSIDNEYSCKRKQTRSYHIQDILNYDSASTGEAEAQRCGQSNVACGQRAHHGQTDNICGKDDILHTSAVKQRYDGFLTKCVSLMNQVVRNKNRDQRVQNQRHNSTERRTVGCERKEDGPGRHRPDIYPDGRSPHLRSCRSD